ncbi:MAG: Nif3-like dinuclear metal center hexameric protein [Phascolarctobacterium sp.]|nr:Nif3-like dinuclear metal center hexameric protein [Phascolarctobacterium sp.]
MLATVNDLVELLEELMPSNLAEDWDNVGLMLGRKGKTVKKILLALDLTKEVVEQAIAQKADLIVTHHPAIFKKLKRVVDNDWQQDLLLTLAEHGIAVYSAHTNLDCVSTGVNDVLAKLLKLEDADVLDEGNGLGRIGTVEEMSLTDYAQLVKTALKADYVVVGDAGKTVRKVAVCGGAGSDLIDLALAKSADTLVTGDVKYHSAQQAVFSGLNIIDAGHQPTELPVLDKLADRLSLRLVEREIDVVVNVARETLLLRHV